MIQRLLSIFCLILVFSCNSNLQDELDYYSNSCNNADSILDFYSDNYQNQKVDRRFLAIAFNRVQTTSSPRKAELFLNSWHKRLNSLPSVARFYYHASICRSILYSDRDSANLLIEKMLAVPEIIELDSMTAYELKGLAFYYRNMLDSSLLYMKKAYKISLKQNFKGVIGSFATNLGGLYSLNGNPHSATEYLIRALSYDSTNSVLINNLASVLILEDRYEEASDLFKKFPEKLVESKKDPQLFNFKLTYVNLNQKIGNWQVSKNWLNSINMDEVPEMQKINYNLFKLEQLNHDEPQSIRHYLNNLITTSGWDFYNNMFYTFSDVLCTKEYEALAEHFENNIEKLDTSEYDDLCFSTYYHLLGNRFSKWGNHRLASKYFKAGKERYFAYDIASDKAEKSDLGSQLELIQMEQKRVEANNNAEVAQLELRRNKIITYFSVSFLIGGLFVGIRWKRLTDKNLKLNKDLFEQKKNELEILEREKLTSKKLIELSARVLEKSKDLKHTISGLPDTSNPRIRKSLDDLDYLLLMNKSVDTTVISRGYALEQFSFLDGITDSQRNVLSLSLDGYRPKEIAVTLNLSYSYVRNVQSKLRKILKNQGFDNFEDFKNDINL